MLLQQNPIIFTNKCIRIFNKSQKYLLTFSSSYNPKNKFLFPQQPKKSICHCCQRNGHVSTLRMFFDTKLPMDETLGKKREIERKIWYLLIFRAVGFHHRVTQNLHRVSRIKKYKSLGLEFFSITPSPKKSFIFFVGGRAIRFTQFLTNFVWQRGGSQILNGKGKVTFSIYPFPHLPFNTRFSLPPDILQKANRPPASISDWQPYVSRSKPEWCNCICNYTTVAFSAS